MEEIGIVKERKGSKLTVEIERSPHCAGCGMCIASAGGRNLIEVEDDGSGVLAGDKVVLSVPGSDILKISFLTYVMPLSLFFLGVLLGYIFLDRGAGLTAISGIIGLLAGFLVLKAVEQELKKRGLIKITVKKA